MDPRITGNRSSWSRVRGRAQTSFLDQGAGTSGEGSAPREVEDALGVADRAADTATRRDALDHLYGYLAEQATKRGRKPVPKRGDVQEQR